MTYLAVDKDGSEWIYSGKPHRGNNGEWRAPHDGRSFLLPTGTIAKLIRGGLTWEDEPEELIEEK